MRTVKIQSYPTVFVERRNVPKANKTPDAGIGSAGPGSGQTTAGAAPLRARTKNAPPQLLKGATQNKLKNKPRVGPMNLKGAAPGNVTARAKKVRKAEPPHGLPVVRSGIQHSMK